MKVTLFSLKESIQGDSGDNCYQGQENQYQTGLNPMGQYKLTKT